MKLIIPEDAEDDLAQAYNWYEQHRDGLGLEFANAVETCIDGILRQPLAHQVVYEKPEPLRRAVLHRFPYGVLYHVRPDAIVVIAVFHGRLNPERLRRRLWRNG
jgi:toxin ParE1/3/4